MGHKVSTTVKDGLHSFIVKSNIDIDQLSANLSQKQENRRLSNLHSQKSGSILSRSKSDRSRQAYGSSKQAAGGPGLPRPSLARSRKLAEHYRKESRQRRSLYQTDDEVDEARTPQQSSSKLLPRPVEQPHVMGARQLQISAQK